MQTQSTNARRTRTQSILLACLIVCGLAAAIVFQRQHDDARSANASISPEELYVSSDTASSIVPRAFRGVVADWYWMRSIQYLGGKIVAEGDRFNFGNLGTLDLRLLPSLIETTTRLDPEFLPAYEYAAMVLPEVNRDAALRIIDGGIAANPDAWKLWHHRGYILWQAGEFSLARDAYIAGSQIPGARAWMRSLAARMEAEGGSRGTARELYKRIYDEAEDDSVKKSAMLSLLRLKSLDEQDAIRRVLGMFVAERGACPRQWREAAMELRRAGLRLDATGAPVDPSDAPYVLTKDCDITLAKESKVPKR